MVVYLFESIFDLSDSTAVEWLTLLILTITLIVVCIYTYFTHKLQKISEQQTNELIKQRRLSKMPSIITDIVLTAPDALRPNFHVPELNMTNAGNGLAIGIKVENISIPFIEPEIANDSIEIKFEKLDFLRETQTKTLNGYYADHHPDESEMESIIGYFEDTWSELDFIITFQDIEGGRYKQINYRRNGSYIHGAVKSIDD